MKKDKFLNMQYVLPDYACNDPEVAVKWLCWVVKDWRKESNELDSRD